MEIKKQPMGGYQTNCYIVTIDGKDLIIDPGVGATKWILQNVTNPIDVSSFSPGIYIMEFVTDDLPIREKLLIE